MSANSLPENTPQYHSVQAHFTSHGTFFVFTDGMNMLLQFTCKHYAQFERKSNGCKADCWLWLDSRTVQPCQEALVMSSRHKPQKKALSTHMSTHMHVLGTKTIQLFMYLQAIFHHHINKSSMHFNVFLLYSFTQEEKQESMSNRLPLNVCVKDVSVTVLELQVSST